MQWARSVCYRKASDTLFSYSTTILKDRKALRIHHQHTFRQFFRPPAIFRAEEKQEHCDVRTFDGGVQERNRKFIRKVGEGVGGQGEGGGGRGEGGGGGGEGGEGGERVGK